MSHPTTASLLEDSDEDDPPSDDDSGKKRGMVSDMIACDSRHPSPRPRALTGGVGLSQNGFMFGNVDEKTGKLDNQHFDSDAKTLTTLVDSQIKSHNRIDKANERLQKGGKKQL